MSIDQIKGGHRPQPKPANSQKKERALGMNFEHIAQVHHAASGTQARDSSLKDDGIHTMPLTVEMVADFPSIFSLIRTVESQDRLVRISSLRIDRIPDERSDNPQSRLAEATIQLDAIYASQPEQEDVR